MLNIDQPGVASITGDRYLITIIHYCLSYAAKPLVAYGDSFH